MANQRVPDEEVLAFATAQGRAVLTYNRRDFTRLHIHSPIHAGIIVCTAMTTVDADEQAKRIHRQLISAQDLSGQLLRVTRPQKPRG
jgi:hypothetical protein